MGSADNGNVSVDEDKIYGYVDLFKSAGDTKPIHIYQLSMKKIRIGREQKCEIRIHNLRISRMQCCIKISGTDETRKVRLQNLTTKATTVFKNKGIPQNETVDLEDGDRFRLYDTELRYRAFNPNEKNGLPEFSDGRSPPIIRLCGKEKGSDSPEKSSLYKKSPRSEKSRPSRSFTRGSERLNKSTGSGGDKTPRRRKSSDIDMRRAVLQKSFRKSVQGKNFPEILEDTEDTEIIDLDDDDNVVEEGESDSGQFEEPMEIDDDEVETQDSCVPDQNEVAGSSSGDSGNATLRCPVSPEEDLIQLSPVVPDPPEEELSEDLIQFHDIERAMSLLHGEGAVNTVEDNDGESVFLHPESGLVEPSSSTAGSISDSGKEVLILRTSLVLNDAQSASTSLISGETPKIVEDGTVTIISPEDSNTTAGTSVAATDNISHNASISGEVDDALSLHESSTQVLELHQTLNLDGKSFYTAADEDEHQDISINDSQLLTSDNNGHEIGQNLDQTISDKSDDAEDIFEDAQGDENAVEENLFEESMEHEILNSDPVEETLRTEETVSEKNADLHEIEVVNDTDTAAEGGSELEQSNVSVAKQSNAGAIGNEQDDVEEDPEPEVVDIADDSSEDNEGNYSLGSDDELENELIDLVDSPDVESGDSAHQPLPDISPEDVESIIPVGDSSTRVESEELQNGTDVREGSEKDNGLEISFHKDSQENGMCKTGVENSAVSLSSPAKSGTAAIPSGEKEIVEIEDSSTNESETVAVVPHEESSIHDTPCRAEEEEDHAENVSSNEKEEGVSSVVVCDDDGSDKELQKEDKVSASNVELPKASDTPVENANSEQADDISSKEESARAITVVTPDETEPPKTISAISINSEGDSDIEDDLKSVSDFDGGKNEKTKASILASVDSDTTNDVAVDSEPVVDDTEDVASVKSSGDEAELKEEEHDLHDLNQDEISDNKENIVEPVSEHADSEDDFSHSFRSSSRSSKLGRRKSVLKKQSSRSDSIVKQNYSVKDCSVVLSRIKILVDTADSSGDEEPKDDLPLVNDSEAIFSDLTNEPLPAVLDSTPKAEGIPLGNRSGAKEVAVTSTPTLADKLALSTPEVQMKSIPSSPASKRIISPTKIISPHISDIEVFSVAALNGESVSALPKSSTESAITSSKQVLLEEPSVVSMEVETLETSSSKLVETSTFSVLEESPKTSAEKANTVVETSTPERAEISVVSTPKADVLSPSLTTPSVADKSMNSTPLMKDCSILIERLSITEDSTVVTTPKSQSKKKHSNAPPTELKSPAQLKLSKIRDSSSTPQLRGSPETTKFELSKRKRTSSHIEIVDLEEAESGNDEETKEPEENDNQSDELPYSKLKTVQNRVKSTELDKQTDPGNLTPTPKRGRPKKQKDRAVLEVESDIEKPSSRDGDSKIVKDDSDAESEADQVVGQSPKGGSQNKGQIVSESETEIEVHDVVKSSGKRGRPRVLREISESEESDAVVFKKPSSRLGRTRNQRELSVSEDSEAEKSVKSSRRRGRPKTPKTVVASESESESGKGVKPSPSGRSRGRPRNHRELPASEENEADKNVKQTPRGRPKATQEAVVSESEAEGDADKAVKKSSRRVQRQKTTQKVEETVLLSDDSDAESEIVPQSKRVRAGKIEDDDDSKRAQVTKQSRQARGRGRDHKGEEDSDEETGEKNSKPESPKRKRTARHAVEKAHEGEELGASSRRTRGQARHDDIEEIIIDSGHEKKKDASKSKTSGVVQQPIQNGETSDSESENAIQPKSKRGRYDNEESKSVKTVISYAKSKSELKGSRREDKANANIPANNIEKELEPVVKSSSRGNNAVKEENRVPTKRRGKPGTVQKSVDEEDEEEDQEDQKTGDSKQREAVKLAEEINKNASNKKQVSKSSAKQQSVSSDVDTEMSSGSRTRVGLRNRANKGSQPVVALVHLEDLEEATENLRVENVNSIATSNAKERKPKGKIAPPPTTTSRGNRKDAMDVPVDIPDSDDDVEEHDLPSHGRSRKTKGEKPSNLNIKTSTGDIAVSQIDLTRMAQPVVVLEYMDSDEEKEKMAEQRKRNRTAVQKAKLVTTSDDDRVERKPHPKRCRTRKAAEEADPSSSDAEESGKKSKRLRRQKSAEIVTLDMTDKNENEQRVVSGSTDSDDEAAVPEKVAPVKSTTGKGKRGRARTTKATSPVDEQSEPIDDIQEENEPSTKSRPIRMQNKEIKEKEQNINSKVKTASKGKGRHTKEVVDPTPAEDISDDVIEEEQSKTSTSRTNSKKTAAGPGSKSKAKAVPKTSGRGRPAKVMEEVEKESSEDEGEGDEEPEPEPPKVAKRGLKRAKGKNTELESEVRVATSSAAKNKKSSKKDSPTEEKSDGKGKQHKVQIVQKAPKDRVVLQLPQTNEDDDVIALSSDDEEPSVSPATKRLRTGRRVATPAKQTKPSRSTRARRAKK